MPDKVEPILESVRNLFGVLLFRSLLRDAGSHFGSQRNDFTAIGEVVS